MNNELQTFSESNYYSAYKRIRNKFRKYNSLSIIVGCINYLYQPTKDDIDKIQKHPWLVLLLVKWMLLDDQFNIHNKKTITNNKLYEILQAVRDLAELTRLPTDFEHHTLFFRSMAYQQLFYQHQFSISNFARQKILFGSLQENNLIQREFRELTGLDISRFLELSLITSVRFISQNNSTIPANWYNQFLNQYSPNEIQNFLDSISSPLLSIRETLLTNDNRRRTAQEFFEQTPFIEFPLINTGQDFLCSYPNVLYRCLEHYIYDRMRKWNAQLFMNKFGPMFEKYVEKSINYTGLPYINETELKQCLHNKGNLIDFIVVDKDSNIFIDAKAVEMSYQGKVAHLSDVVKDKSKASVIKAIKQSHDVIKQLESFNDEHQLLKHRKNNYLLVITFKELYLGNGRTFYEAIAKEKIDSIYNEYQNSTNIELENMYFITIEEFDIFSELIKTKKIGMVEALEEAKQKDSQPLSKKFDFWLHLMSWGNSGNIPTFLRNESNAMFEKLKGVIGEKSQADQ